MSNEYYTREVDPLPYTRGRTTQLTNPLDRIEAGFDKLPPPDETEKGFTSTIAIEDGTATNHAASVGQWINNSPLFGSVSSDGAIYSATVSAPVSAYYTGMTVVFLADLLSVSTCFLNVNALGAKPLIFPGGEVVGAGGIVAGEVIIATYNGSSFVVLGKGVTDGSMLPKEYSDTATYSFPDQVVHINGHTYRCLGEEVSGDDPSSSSSGNWLKIPSEQPVVSVETSSFNCLRDTEHFVDTSAGDITATLPSSPVVGMKTHITDYSGTFSVNRLTVARNGNKIMGLDEDMTVSSNWAGVTFLYVNTTLGWRVK